MESCSVDERKRFLRAALSKEESFSRLFRGFGISRKTGYKWLERYERFGGAGLLERSRRPLHSPHALSDEVLERCLSVRRLHPT
ncbi:MAG: leucine zipper domain-containing protein [Alphaproteobacteria bacterium]|jgi:transposase|nr:leucine zipper domain-containing protein [Alphaproteobacteria bacterium]